MALALPFTQTMLLSTQLCFGMWLHLVNPFAAAYFDALEKPGRPNDE